MPASPSPYIEGWFVGAGGFTEIGSDAELDNEISITTYLHLGYRATAKLRFFQKNLRQQHP